MAWTTPKTWSVGETLTAANFNTHIRDNFNTVPHLLARKTADEIVNNSAALQDDNHLLFAVGTSEVWFFNGYIMCDGATAADIKFACTVPAGATLRFGYGPATDGTNHAAWTAQTTGSAPPALAAGGASAGSAGTSGVGTIIGLELVGIVATAGTAGNVTIQWAQATANATDTTVRQNSLLIGFKVA